MRKKSTATEMETCFHGLQYDQSRLRQDTFTTNIS